MNGEGYRDPTADQAIYRASRLPEPIWNVIKAVRAVLEVSHLELTGIQMVDRKNRKSTHGEVILMERIRGENEEKKEYLKRYHAAVLAEKEIQEEIDQLRMDKMFPGMIQDGMPHGSSCGDLSAYAVQLEELNGQPESTDGAADPAEEKNHAED